MIAAEQRDPIRIFGLECEKTSEGLQRIIPAIHEIAHEYVIGVWNGSTTTKQLLQIIELTVDIATNRHGRGHGLNIGLFQQKIADNITKFL